MRPDIKSHHANSMFFCTDLVLEDDYISKIHSVSPPDKDGDSLFAEYYNSHTALVWVIPPEKQRARDRQPFHIHFDYMSGRRKIPTKGAPQIRELIDILAPISQEVSFYCRLIFEFKRSLKPKPIIKLPIKYTESPTMPFDTIQGLRLLKIDGRNRKHDVILEALPGGIIAACVIFDHVCKFGDSLPDEIFQQGTAIVDSFVSRR